MPYRHWQRVAAAPDVCSGRRAQPPNASAPAAPAQARALGFEDAPASAPKRRWPPPCFGQRPSQPGGADRPDAGAHTDVPYAQLLADRREPLDPAEPLPVIRSPTVV